MSEILGHISDWINIVIVPLMGLVLFYGSKRRAERAKASREEILNDEKVADQWQELCSKYEEELKAKDANIDQLYAEKSQDRKRILDLMQEKSKLELDFQAADFRRCNVRGCHMRQPPSDY